MSPGVSQRLFVIIWRCLPSELCSWESGIGPKKDLAVRRDGSSSKVFEVPEKGFGTES